MGRLRSWSFVVSLVLLALGSGGAVADDGEPRVCDSAPCACALVEDAYEAVHEVLGADEGDGLEGLLKSLLRRVG